MGTIDDEWVIDPLPTVTHDGDVVLLSPELAGYHDDRYGDFVVGNLYAPGETLHPILARGPEVPYVCGRSGNAIPTRSTLP